MYYARLNPEELQHARCKPFSDPECGKYLSDMGALLQMLLPPPKTILDLGCGTGWTSLFLARAGYEVVGVDISADAIKVAQELAAEAQLQRVRFVVADYENLPIAGTFDYALFYDSLHHAEDEQKAVTAAYRLLSSSGVLFAFEPGTGHSRSRGAEHAVATYQVHEKDMPPRHVWRLGRRAGFRRRLFLPSPHEVTKGLYRRDFLCASNAARLILEKCWGYWRVATKFMRAARSGVTVMWK